ncbi:MAG: hypothetical protein JWQ55_5493 [Rhodopila sp.]|nr:hypothetical protein [Rhodopila sp.]
MPGGVRGGRREASPYSIRVGVAAAREINMRAGLEWRLRAKSIRYQRPGNSTKSQPQRGLA